MVTAFLAVGVGLGLLVWSAERFIDGAAALARHVGMSSLLIGMVVVGFGTSAPEMTVSALAAAQGNAGIALGNAYGSNITNIALILGLAALLNPITVHSQVLRRELPVLTAVSALAAWQLADGMLSRADAGVLLAVFAGLLAWSVASARTSANDALAGEVDQAAVGRSLPPGRALVWLIVGLVLLVASSRLLVWGAVEIARGYQVSDLVIGLTIVAVGTSLPELASSLVAARKGEHDLALGNIIGSNLFNTLAVVGLAGLIRPLAVAPEVLGRDIAVMGALTVSLFLICYGFRGPGRVNRLEGAALLLAFVAYTGYLLASAR